MSENTNTIINASITFGDVKVQFNGSPESVLTSIINFLTKHIPTLDLAKKISLNYAVTDLIETYSSMIKITPEGPRVIISEPYELGIISNDAMQASEIQSTTALNPKSVSSRLSELVKAGYVVRDNIRDGAGSSVVYRITTSGIHWLTSTMIKRIKPPSMTSSSSSSIPQP